MTIDDNVIDEKIQFDITEKQQNYQLYLEVKLIKKNILQVKKYYHLTKAEQQDKLNVHILRLLNHFKNK